MFLVFLHKEEHQGLILVEACHAKFWVHDSVLSESVLYPVLTQHAFVVLRVCVVRLSSEKHEFTSHPNATDPLCHAQA